MKPSRPYHAVTAYYREPGGLRRLDFFVDRIAAWKGDRKKVRVLDIGCGNGNVSLPLSSLGYAVTGVDYDGPSIKNGTEMAKELGLTARFIQGSLDKLPGQKFDVIIASEVLEHQKDPHAFLEELRSICEPDGLLLLSVPNGQSLEERIRRITTHTDVGLKIKTVIKKQIGHEGVQSSANHPHEQFFSFRTLRTTLYGAGWKIQTEAPGSAGFKEFYYLFGRLFMKRGSPTFHALDKLDNWVAPIMSRSMSDGWLLEVRPFDPAKTRVVHVVSGLAAGGAERLVYQLVGRLPTQGFEAQAVALLGGGPLETLFRDDQLTLTVFPRRGVQGWWASFRRLCRLLERERPSVVHTHLFGADVIGRLAAAWERIPVIISTEHNVNPDHGTMKRWVKRCLVGVTTAFIAISNEVKAFMTREEGIPAAKIHVIPNGIDLARVVPRRPGSFHDIPRLLVVGRLTEQKGHEILLEALAQVKRPWALDVVGTGTLEADLKAQAERLGIASRIRWLGYRNDVPQLLADTDLFCLPSRWEGLSLVLLEAAAAGVPIVASDLPVFHEVLEPHQASFVPVGEVSAMAQAIEAILRDPIPVVRVAYESALSVHDRFSLERMVEGYAHLYRDELSKCV